MEQLVLPNLQLCHNQFWEGKETNLKQGNKKAPLPQQEPQFQVTGGGS